MNVELESVIVYDEWDGRWKIEFDEPLFEEAQKATEALRAAENGNTYAVPRLQWPLAKILQNKGWGWWSVYKKLDEFETDLEKTIPNPGKQRLIRLETEYTPKELSDLLQVFGSYLSTLHHMESMAEAQCHALKEGFKTGLAVAVARSLSTANTVSAKENEVLAENELLKDTRKRQITQEACLILLKGWRQSYEAAYTAISRIIALRTSEMELQQGAH